MSANFSHTARLTESALSWLTAKLAKWPQVQIVAAPVEDEDGSVRFDTMVTLDAPVIVGHKLLARIEHLEEGNIIYRCGGEEKPAYRTCKPWCDHCKTARRRNDTFVLLEESTNREKQVGRNCLAEYVRDAGAAAYLLSWADCVDRIVRFTADAEERFSSGRAPETYSLPFCLSWALAYGGKWVSATQARETGEQGSASYLLGVIGQLRHARMFPAGRWLDSREGKNAEAIEAKAQALREDMTSDVYDTIAWIGTLAAKPETQVSDYENNLIVLSRIGYVTVKQWGFACSAFRAWLRAKHIAAGEAERVAVAALPVSGNHVGTIGERLGFEKANCTDVKSLGVGDFGERFLVKFTTAAGDDLVWFTGEGQPFEAGTEYNITGTVKEHKEFAKRRNTTLSRVAEGLPKPKGKKKKAA